MSSKRRFKTNLYKLTYKLLNNRWLQISEWAFDDKSVTLTE